MLCTLLLLRFPRYLSLSLSPFTLLFLYQFYRNEVSICKHCFMVRHTTTGHVCMRWYGYTKSLATRYHSRPDSKFKVMENCLHKNKNKLHMFIPRRIYDNIFFLFFFCVYVSDGPDSGASENFFLTFQTETDKVYLMR